MKYLVTTSLLMLCALVSSAQTLYTKTYGNSKNEPVIFIHGGPGSSSIAFGVTTAERLAGEGFYVITYDRRGEGLSKDKNAKYNFQQTFEDLDGIYNQFKIRKATLIGFSFGGIVSTLYTQRNPAKVKSLVLVSSLLSQPETYQTVLKKSKAIYELQKDTANLNDILRIEKMDKNSFEYRADCFKHSSKNGFFATKNQSNLAKSLYKKLASDSLYLQFNATKSNDPVLGFWKNEKYSNMSIMATLKKLKARKMNIYALYGKDDGLFSNQQILNLQDITGKDRLKYLDNCSHYLYTDQQDDFINSIALLK